MKKNEKNRRKSLHPTTLTGVKAVKEAEHNNDERRRRRSRVERTKSHFRNASTVRSHPTIDACSRLNEYGLREWTFPQGIVCRKHFDVTQVR